MGDLPGSPGAASTFYFLFSLCYLPHRTDHGQPSCFKMRILNKGALFCSKNFPTRIRKEGRKEREKRKKEKKKKS
jgi:hypothetical protein